MITYDRTIFFTAIKSVGLHKSLNPSQVDGYMRLLSYAERIQDPLKFLAYRLATTKWETASTMQPIEEIGKGAGRTYGPTGFFGRGYVQLTWKTNYAKATNRLRELDLIDDKVDFVKTPDLVMVPDYALPILFVGMNEGWFTGRKLSQYFSGTEANPKGARAIINGTDKDDEIAGLYRQYVRALLLAEVPADGQPALVTENGLVTEGIKQIIVALEKLSPLATTSKTRIEKALAALS